MEKTKLIERRKAKGFSQNMIAEKLCMDVSNYNRRERGQVKISMLEWEKLAGILQVPIEDIYESDNNQEFTCENSATVHYQETNHIYSIPESMLESQRKYIERLEAEIRELREKLGQ
jgi:transcriptional regulator with XRE-family HTH domain